MGKTDGHPTGLIVNKTADPTFARQLLNDRYKPHNMRRVSKRQPFDFMHMSAVVPEGSFNILKYGSAVEITPEPFDDFFMLEMPISQGVNIESKGRPSLRSNPDIALFLPPHVRFASTWQDGCVQLMLKVRNAEVLRRWQLMVGDDTALLPRVHPEIDLKTPEGWRVQQIMFLLRQEFERAVQSNSDTMSRSPLTGAVIDAVIAYYRDRQGDQIDGLTYRFLPAHLRNCVQYIDHNLGGDLSIPSLLAHTNVSERSLFNLFQQFLGTTPKGYVQNERLKRSRSLILAGHCNVNEAARRVGFSHMGRFSCLYRKRYGENPSTTKVQFCPENASPIR